MRRKTRVPHQKNNNNLQPSHQDRYLLLQIPRHRDQTPYQLRTLHPSRNLKFWKLIMRGTVKLKRQRLMVLVLVMAKTWKGEVAVGKWKDHSMECRMGFAVIMRRNLEACERTELTETQEPTLPKFGAEKLITPNRYHQTQ
uniref:Uncharacterized protein n=1 Tax=Brassica oleracea TaxID=3712 RepID=A0A3P6FBF2_BRAOL|nr:unnamed protein product [Brassica oleracea]